MSGSSEIVSLNLLTASFSFIPLLFYSPPSFSPFPLPPSFPFPYSCLPSSSLAHRMVDLCSLSGLSPSSADPLQPSHYVSTATSRRRGHLCQVHQVIKMKSKRNVLVSASVWFCLCPFSQNCCNAPPCSCKMEPADTHVSYLTSSVWCVG